MQYILNADDFGRTATANKAIDKCFINNTVTNTSVMVTAPNYEEAKSLAKQNGYWDKVGLHINLTSGYPLTEEIKHCKKLTNSDGRFNGVLFKTKRMFLFLTVKEKRAVKKEVEAQIEKYLSDGFTLLHADSHGHIHCYLPFAKIISKCLKKYNFKSVRVMRNLQVNGHMLKLYKKMVFSKYNKRFYLTNYFGSMGDVIKEKENLEAINGVCEIMLHPNYFDGTFGYGERFDDGIFNKLVDKISYCDIVDRG